MYNMYKIVTTTTTTSTKGIIFMKWCWLVSSRKMYYNILFSIYNKCSGKSIAIYENAIRMASFSVFLCSSLLPFISLLHELNFLFLLFTFVRASNWKRIQFMWKLCQIEFIYSWRIENERIVGFWWCFCWCTMALVTC